jgi:CBS domain-containing protein
MVYETLSASGPALEDLRVSDAMHGGVLTCTLDTPLRDVARIMARYRVHAVVAIGGHTVNEALQSSFWGIVSDHDLVDAVAKGEVDSATAGGIAGTRLVMVDPDESLARGAALMREHQVTHLVVVEPDSTLPVGVLSTLDIAKALSAGQW